MDFVPLNKSQLHFIAEEFWPGGGENGDGRDLYGVAEYRREFRDLESRAFLALEEHGVPGGEQTTPEVTPTETMSEWSKEQWERFQTENPEYDEGNVEDDIRTPPTELEQLEMGECDGRMSSAVATTLARFERDDIRQIGSCLAAYLAHWWWAFCRPINCTGAPECWKHHRSAQYRPHVVGRRAID